MKPVSCCGGGARDDTRGRVSSPLPILASLALAACAFQRYEERPLDAEASAASFAERRLDAPELVAFARERLAPEAAFPPAAWDLDALALTALFYRGELDLARAELAEARGALVSAGARPNPRLALDTEVVPGADSPWILGWLLEFPIETAGKRGLREDAAAARVRAAELALPQAAWRVRAEVRAAWLELTAAHARAGWLEQERAAADERLEARRALLAAGEISGPELLRDEQERARLAAEVEGARTRGERALAELATALAVPRPVLAEVAVAAPGADWPEAPSAEGARELGLRNRVDLHARLHEYAAAEADLRLEIARQYPDFSLSPGTSWDQGDHKYALGFAIELPIFQHNQGPIAEAEARRAASGARFLALQEEAIGAIETARVDYAGALREREQARAELELARRREEAARATLAAGASGRLELLDARLLRLGLERALAESDERTGVALGALEDQLQRPLAGAPLPSLSETAP